MSLMKFKIVSPKDDQSVDNVFETLLINTDHIISLKPIRMVVNEKLVIGFWIRTTNGKKYRAVEIPEEIKLILGDSVLGKSKIVNGELAEDLNSLDVLN